MRRWKSKAGAIEIQFNWIFVLIIGALIITFFVMIAQKQKQVSDRSLAADILSDMELIFTGQGVAVGREDVLEMPNIPIDVSCTDFSMMGVPKSLGQAILFAPARIEAEELITWTLSWDVPFRVAPFMYMTGADDKYYVVAKTEGGCTSSDDDDETKWGPVIDSERDLTLGEILPKSMDVKCVAVGVLDGLDYEENPYVKFIFLPGALPDGPGPLALPIPDVFEESGARVSVLVIDPSPDTELAYGWENGGAMLHLSTVRVTGAQTYPMESFPAFGTEAVLGAVFASDYETYECMMGRAIERMRSVAKVYKERTQRLITRFDDAECTRYLPYTLLDNYIDFPERGAAGSVDAIKTHHITDLARLGDSPLRQAVRQAQRASCPTIY